MLLERIFENRYQSFLRHPFTPSWRKLALCLNHLGLAEAYEGQSHSCPGHSEVDDVILVILSLTLVHGDRLA